MKNWKKIIVILVLFIVYLLFIRKPYDIKTYQYDDKVVVLIKNTTNDPRDYSIKGTSNKIYYLLPEETSAFVIKKAEYDNIKIVSNKNTEYKEFYDYDVNEERNITKQEVNVEIINNTKQREIDGEVILVFYKDNNIVNIELKNISLNNNINISYKEDILFDDVEITYRFWDK